MKSARVLAEAAALLLVLMVPASPASAAEQNVDSAQEARSLRFSDTGEIQPMPPWAVGQASREPAWMFFQDSRSRLPASAWCRFSGGWVTG